MPIYKRLNGKKVNRGEPGYSKATWVAEGQLYGQRYKAALKLAKTKEDAEREEDRIRASIGSGEYDFQRDKTKFSEFVDEVYLPYAKEKNDSYGVKLTETKHLKAHFKDSLLKHISVAHCEKFKNKRRLEFKRCQKCGNGLEHECVPVRISTETVNRELATLSKILNLACHHQKIKSNPMQFVEKFKKVASRERFLTLNEKDVLLAEIVANKQLLAIVLLGLLTGWRKGQILSLKASAMDADTQTVKVIKSKQQKPRRVPVGDLAWQIMADLAKDSAADWLFYNPRSKTHLKDFAKTWKGALSKAGISDFRFHDIRRSTATKLLDYGTDVFTIQKVLGHANLATTGIYSIPQAEAMRNALNEMGKDYEEYLH